VPRFRPLDLASWGNCPIHPCLAARPEKVRDLSAILADATIPSVISRGLGRSYGDAALNRDAGVVLHERLNRFLAFDPETGVLECEAGVSFADLISVFLPRGWFPPVTPGTRFVTLGGALAADVHGKNHHVDGSFSEFVEEFTLLTGSGRILRCSRTENPEAFYATIGGMGLTGMVISLRLRLRRVESAFIAADYRRARHLDEALELFTSATAGHAAFDSMRYCVAWLDCLARGGSLGRCVLMGGEHAAASVVPARFQGRPLEFPLRSTRTLPPVIPNGALNALTVRAFNAVYYRANRDGSRVIPFDSFFYPLDAFSHWNRLYGPRGFQQYQVVVPPENSRRALVRLLEELTASRRGSFLAVLKSMGRPSEGVIGFAMPGWTLAVDLPNAPGLDDFLRRLDDIVLEHGGRRYLAKDASLSREHFERMYLRHAEFKRTLAALDPEGRISSSMARRLGLDHSAASTAPPSPSSHAAGAPA
jgi:decaprenylphospho-beta-D-ribofuranose 2-oxidase